MPSRPTHRIDEIRSRLTAGERVVLTSDPALNDTLAALGSSMRVLEPVPAAAHPEHPHVIDGVMVRRANTRFTVREAHRISGGAALLVADHDVVAAEEALLEGVLVLLPELPQDTSFSDVGRAAALSEIAGTARAPEPHGGARAVDTIAEVHTGGWALDAPPRGTPLTSDAMLTSVRRAARVLPEHVVDAVLTFQEAPHDSGALLLRGCPIDELPPTPESPTAQTRKSLVSEHTLLSVARLLGQPVGYLPEHGGDLVQNILPTRSGADRQVSTSSTTTLLYHTEAAFHPWRPRWLLLLCLRGDENATTTLVSVRDLVRVLPDHTLRTLSEPRFVTGIDESYAGARSHSTTAPHAVLSGSRTEACIRYDAELTTGLDLDAREALATLNGALGTCQGGVVLTPGDLIIIDNTIAIHGRSPFTPRFDGTDRWLQRSFVIADLHEARSELDGRIVATRFRR